ncbi:MAG: UxaA family hydrolase, partial [Pseudomonadota bacterium]
MSGEPIDALILHPEDHVASVLRDIAAEEQVTLSSGGLVRANTLIPLGHKIAICNVPAGGRLKKYGAVIGETTAAICTGDHVHLHNLTG